MIPFAVYSGIALVLLVLLAVAWRLTVPRRPSEPPGPLSLEELLPVHCRYFPQVRQALSTDDHIYLKERASAGIWRQSRADRKRVAARFLLGLQKDFLRLERLGRAVAALSPRVSRKQELERLWLGVRFRLLYRLVWLRLVAGSTPRSQFTRLAQLVGLLAKQTESAMAALGEASTGPLRSRLSA